MFRRIVVFPVLVTMLILFFSGCSKETSVDPPLISEAPTLPSLKTMSVDLDFFATADIDREAIASGAVGREFLSADQGIKTNFFNAAVRVLFLDVVVYSALVEPVTAFALTIHSVPQPQADGSWLWTRIFLEDGMEYGVFLYGKQVEDHVDWRMEVSSTDPEMILDHFIWFEGETFENDTHGYWQFYEPGTAPAFQVTEGRVLAATPGVRLIKIDWEHISSSEERLVLTINKAGDPAEGSRLEFYQSRDYGSVEFFDAQQETTGTIIWYSDLTGSIEWPDYNGGLISCWDAVQDNVDCR